MTTMQTTTAQAVNTAVRMQGGANRGYNTVIFGEIVGGYETPSAGTASEIFPKPGEVALLIRPGDEHCFSTWLLGPVGEIQNHPRFTDLPDSEKKRVLQSLSAVSVQAGIARLAADVESWENDLQSAEQEAKAGIFGAAGLVRHAQKTLAKCKARLDRCQVNDLG